jgi:hypothetical protein
MTRKLLALLAAVVLTTTLAVAGCAKTEPTTDELLLDETMVEDSFMEELTMEEEAEVTTEEVEAEVTTEEVAE